VEEVPGVAIRPVKEEADWGGAILWGVVICAVAGWGMWGAARDSVERSSEPHQSRWDGSVPEAEAWLRRNLKDPASLDVIEWSRLVLDERNDAWTVRCKYRAKNSLGGYVVESKTFHIKDGRVVDAR
jgi:hypothetical protein